MLNVNNGAINCRNNDTIAQHNEREVTHRYKFKTKPLSGLPVSPGNCQRPDLTLDFDKPSICCHTLWRCIQVNVYYGTESKWNEIRECIEFISCLYKAAAVVE